MQQNQGSQKIDCELLRALLADATPGPWESVLYHARPDMEGVRTVEGPVVRRDGSKHVPIISTQTPTADAALMVAMRNALPDLLDRIDRLEWLLETERHERAAERRGPEDRW